MKQIFNSFVKILNIIDKVTIYIPKFKEES